jgi:hypothetical protein
MAFQAGRGVGKAGEGSVRDSNTEPCIATDRLTSPLRNPRNIKVQQGTDATGNTHCTTNELFTWKEQQTSLRLSSAPHVHEPSRPISIKVDSFITAFPLSKY